MKTAHPGPIEVAMDPGPRPLTGDQIAPPEHPLGPSTRALLDRLGDSSCALGSTQRGLLEIAAQLDERDYAGDDHDFPSTGMWLAARLGISHSAACRWIRAGLALRTLPLIEAALVDGSLSLDKVIELTRFATAETEATLVPWAIDTALSAIRKRADESLRRKLDDEQNIEQIRYFTWSVLEEGSQIAFWGQMPAAQASAIVKAVERVAEWVPEQEYDGPHPLFPHLSGSFMQRRADALAWICSQRIAEDADIDRATVVVHTELGTEANATIESGGVIHPETARRLSCDARLETVIHNLDGEIVGIGRASRNVPRWLLRQLKRRDGGCCSFPGCGRRGYLQAHHIVHWEHGGPTDLNNLILSCSFHHKLVHEFRWKVELGPDGVRWFRPDGSGFTGEPSRAETNTVPSHTSLAEA